MTFQDLLASYDYSFPQELIAKEPASPRESARLLIYDRKSDTVSFDTFADIDRYLPKNCVVVFNKTKVIPAKLTLRKTTGGLVSALLLRTSAASIHALASGSFRVGDKLIWKNGHSFTVLGRMDQEASLEPSFPISQLHDLLMAFGETPLPPYMRDSPLSEERRRTEYQTVFAEEEGSVAAPTAGLHFTQELIKKNDQSGRSIAYLTLHVHLGTFAPLIESQWNEKKLHTEYYSIDPATVGMLNDAKAQGRPIVSVGTTTVRALKSASDGATITRPSGGTNLFIAEGDALHFVDHLVTNFHVPRSSLLMLVSAFTGRERLLSLYQRAIEERMRLFSFGDGMLVI